MPLSEDLTIPGMMTWTHWLYNVPLWSWKMESILGTWIWYDASLRHYRLWSCLPWVVMECVVIQWRCRNTSVPLRVLIPNSTVTQAVLISGVITWVGWCIVIRRHWIRTTLVLLRRNFLTSMTVGRYRRHDNERVLLKRASSIKKRSLKRDFYKNSHVSREAQ